KGLAHFWQVAVIVSSRGVNELPDVLPIPAVARPAFNDFQRYIVERHHSRGARWTLARSLIQAVADRLLDATERRTGFVDPRKVAELLGVAAQYLRASTRDSYGRLSPI